MLFSYKQLSRLVDLAKCSVEELTNALTFSGFEVEGVEELASGSNLTTGEIISCVKHPDSDHLHILKVDCGKDGVLDIVCGALNARVGIKTIVALEGAKLPSIDGKIKKGKIRGYESNGMCCSLLELGFDKELLDPNSPSLNGIEELPDDVILGDRDILLHYGLKDQILDINVLPNRPDCLSYIGMAREISALLGVELFPIPEFVPSSYDDKLNVSSLTKYCERFDVLKITDIKVKETPLYIKRSLQSSGIRPVSPIVDLGNYVMLLTGQPLNMYDAKLNPSDTYKAVDDFEGEVEAFDGRKFTLQKGDITIEDAFNRPLSIAGICALNGALITEKSTDIVVEAAIFYHAAIRHTSSRLGLSSPSSQLFIKERNPRLVKEALAVLISVLPEFFNNYNVLSYASYGSGDDKVKSFHFSLDKMNEHLGTSFKENDLHKVLSSYSISYRKVKNKDYYSLKPPIYRVDLNEQCDIEEEVFRYYHSDIKSDMSTFPLTHGSLTERQKKKRRIRELLINRGFLEILTFTLISKEQDSSIRVFSNEGGYTVKNAMTRDHEVVRSDLLPSLLETMKYNIAHNQKDLALFEISDIDVKTSQKLYLSLGLAGFKKDQEDYGKRAYDFYDMKGTIESILNYLGFSFNRINYAYSKNAAFHPTCSCDIFIDKNLIGTFGKLNPEFDKIQAILGELDLGLLLSLKGAKTKVKNEDNAHVVYRDLSFSTTALKDYETLKKTILKANAAIKSVSFFDDFTDKNGVEYIGVTLEIKSKETLKDVEINAILDDAISQVKQKLGLKLRGE